MLKFKLGRIPVTIEWWFWLATVLLGGGASAHTPEEWAGVATWTAVVFVSILVHELGHALAGEYYGVSPWIRLHGFGGVTFLPGARFTRGQSVLVSAAGPAAGFGLGLLLLALSRLLDAPTPLLRMAIADGLYVNFVWTLINLLPIQPLDGGQILSQLLGPARARLTSSIGFVVAALLCVWAARKGLIFSAVMLGMLAYYNFRRERVEGGVITG